MTDLHREELVKRCESYGVGARVLITHPEVGRASALRCNIRAHTSAPVYWQPTAVFALPSFARGLTCIAHMTGGASRHRGPCRDGNAGPWRRGQGLSAII